MRHYVEAQRCHNLRRRSFNIEKKQLLLQLVPCRIRLRGNIQKQRNNMVANAALAAAAGCNKRPFRLISELDAMVLYSKQANFFM